MAIRIDNTIYEEGYYPYECTFLVIQLYFPIGQS